MLLFLVVSVASGSPWDRIGPWNIFDDKDIKGESGTLACAASPPQKPEIIYAGGQNNGVSSGALKTIDGGKHWERKSKGIWDTRVLGVWIHPDSTDGTHVFVGTHSGVYESIDGAESWVLREETASWGNVMSFRKGIINNKPYILCNTQNGIGTLPQDGGKWQFISAPGGIAPNAHLSVVVTKGKTEVLTCIGGWGGGQLYYATLDSPTNATWNGPISWTNGSASEKINCANAAVDPNNRNHFLYSKAGEWRAWESKDGGKTVKEFTNHNTGVYFVMIDKKGWLYTATQAGAFVSQDGGANWEPYHVMMHSRSGRFIDRVPHDYQRIVPDFREDHIAFPSDQGLHIVNETSFNLTSACGDLHNTMSLSALISPNSNGSRNIVSNIWDWDVAASWDDGATWAGWAPTEKSPGSCGEGGGGQNMGRSGKLIMFHHNHWWSSLDGGHNFIRGDFPGTAGSFDYVRQPGSRTEPAGTCYAILDKSSDVSFQKEHILKKDSYKLGYNWSPVLNKLRRTRFEEANHKRIKAQFRSYQYRPGVQVTVGDSQKVLLVSEDFGQNWTWTTPFPAQFQAGSLAQDPTNAKTLYAWTDSCLAKTTDKGATWSQCIKAPGLTGRFSSLIIKTSLIMFMMRSGAVPLRTTDGGKNWSELTALAPLYKGGATFDASLSWTGNTLVVHGGDLGAIGRKEFGTAVWKSTDDGNTWKDETGDIVTISPGPGVWFEKDFYFVTRGEGITVKRNFEA